MIRFGMVAVLIAVSFSDVAEARGRNKGGRIQSAVWRTQTPIRYSVNTSTSQLNQNSFQSSQTPVQTAGYVTPVNQGMQGGSMQAWAEEEARLMASRGTCGHVRSAPPGYFVGVGCGMTCMGRGTLVAEAHYMGKSVRVWKL